MNKKYFNVPVSLKDNNARIVEGVVQNDTADIFNIKLYDGADSFDFSGYTMVVISVLRPDGTEYINSDGANLDILDAEEGRIAFTLPASLTAKNGMHFASVTIYANGVKLTSGRFNYFVQESLTSGDGAVSTNEYPLLEQLLAKLSLISDAEQMRNEAETLRVLAENARISDTYGVIAQAKELAQQAQSYAKSAQDWYRLLVTYAGDITNTDLTGIATTQDITDALAAIDCGEFTGSSTKKLQFRRGAASNLPALAMGEPAFADGKLFVGSAEGNVQVNGPAFVAQATAPTDTSKLWIDTAHGNAIKFYNGESWSGTATATFA